MRIDYIVAFIMMIPAWITLIFVTKDHVHYFLHRKEYKKVEVVQQSYEDYLKSNHWQRVRAEALERAEYKCQLCGARNVQFNVHHNSYANKGHELDSDLIVLCRRCHSNFHRRKNSH